MSGRTAFVVDGFNVYHSLVDASKSLGLPNETGTKWLNLRELCESYIPLFGTDATFAGAYYFSALAHHLQNSHPGVTARHQHYAKVLRATGVVVELGRFKKKPATCHHCMKKFMRHEEKETDVAVAVKMFELFTLNQADRVVLVTGDTDLVPAVKTAKQLFPGREISFAFPWNRQQEELKKLATGQCIGISRENYHAHQFKDPAVIAGKSYPKPPAW